MKRTNQKPASQQMATYIVQQINGANVALPIVIDLDGPLHTAANGYHCNDSTCPCNAPAEDGDDDNEGYPLGQPRQRNHEAWEDYL